jgi:hypothetical protein
MYVYFICTLNKTIVYRVCIDENCMYKLVQKKKKRIEYKTWKKENVLHGISF